MSPAAAARRDRQAARAEERALHPRRTGSGRGRALLRRGFYLAAVVAAFGVVVWRQERAVERERELRAVESDLAVAEAERVELANRIQALRSRARVVRVARERLRMHLPGDAEIVLLPLPADPAAGGDPDAVASR